MIRDKNIRLRCLRTSARIAGFLSIASCCALAQAVSESTAPTTATTKQLMLDLIYPASNDLLLSIYRGGPKEEKEWAAVRRSAVTLAESASLLAMPGRARDQVDWRKNTKLLADVGAAAYKAALAKDAKSLESLAERLDTSCTTCHKQYRPNVFPREGGSK